MYDMKTEVKKKLEHGFFLREQDLRRVFATMDSLLERRIAKASIRHKLEIKLDNGAVSAPTSIDQILEQENIGSKAVRRIVLEASDGAGHLIRITFQSDVSGDESPIEYIVQGEDRDWTLVATSELEERLSLIRRRRWRNVAATIRNTVALGVTIFLAISFLSLTLSPQSPSSLGNEAVAQVRQRWEQHELTEPIEVMFEIDRARSLTRELSPFAQFVPIIMVTVMTALICARQIERAIAITFPSLHFYWGEYIIVYDKRRSRANLVLIVIFLGSVVSVFSSFLWSIIERLVKR
jgi:hypothetical protein